MGTAALALISIKDIRLNWKGCGQWVDTSPKHDSTRAESEIHSDGEESQHAEKFIVFQYSGF